MVAEVQDVAANRREHVALDPFAHFDGVTSKIRGLGGSKPSQEPRYVFHTSYVEAGRGRAEFVVRFDNLVARRGTLLLQINMSAMDGTPFARLVTTERLTLNRLANDGGLVVLGFEAFRGMGYAIFGMIADETDASADGLTVTLDRPVGGEDGDMPAEDGVATRFEAEAVRPIAFLIDTSRPSFAEPVSQPWSPRQATERALTEWRRDLGDGDDKAFWREAFVLQALRRYGMLRDGARALGIAIDLSSRVPATLLRHGVAPTVGVDPAVIDRIDPADGIDWRPVDPETVAQSFVNYDIIWSNGLFAGERSAAAIAHGIATSIRCIRPGGIAVHILGMRRDDDSDGLLPVEIERLGLKMISYGHDIARLKISTDIPAIGDAAVPFGLIVRRGPRML